MFIDARTVPARTKITADVCIVGAGPAGIVLARGLAHRSVRVVVLESGGLEPDRATQELYRGRSTGLPYYRLDACRLRYFGGTSNHWVGESRPFDDVDFETREGIPHSGWPFSRRDLLPFYRRAGEILQLISESDDAHVWADPPTPVLPLPTTRVVSQVVQNSPVRFGPTYQDEIGQAPRVHVYLHANLVAISTSADARTVRDVEAATLEGNRFHVAARLFVLACGGIENARLLLLPQGSRTLGLGNEHDLVGRFFMEHPETEAALWLPSDPALELKFYGRRLFAHGGARRWVRGSLTLPPDLMRREQLLNFRCELHPVSRQGSEEGAESLAHIASDLSQGRVPEDFAHHLRNVLTDVDGLTDRLRREVFGDPPTVLRLLHVSEQAPNPDSRVTLSQDRDRLGLPRVDLNWRLSEVDRRCLRRSQAIVAGALAEAGLGRVRWMLGDDDRAWRVRGQYHHMGTTRMHTNPKQGVVDAQCRVHAISNLFVAGSSVFPTSSCGTPTLTIVALALRLADHLTTVLKG
jgi:choline dehydrogenase-like flavoprotein